MKKLFFLSILIGFYFSAYTQNSELSNAFKEKDYQKVLSICKERIKSDSTDIEVLLGMGKSYNQLNEFEKAIPFLLKANKHATEDWQISWSLIDLMISHYAVGKTDTSKMYYQKALLIKGTENSEKTIQQFALLVGFDKYYDNWDTFEKENIIFHIQKGTPINDIENYMKAREDAYTNINGFFSSTLPKKIDFFVWKSPEKAKKVLGASLGFTKPEYCVSHNKPNQTSGHEIAHNISFWKEKNNVRTRFINEGIGVYFDQTNQNRIEIARKIATKKQIDVKDMWINGNNYNETELYPVAGAWVGALAKFNKEKFMQLSENQTYENALLIYGDELNSMIKEFNNKINTP